MGIDLLLDRPPIENDFEYIVIRRRILPDNPIS